MAANVCVSRPLSNAQLDVRLAAVGCELKDITVMADFGVSEAPVLVWVLAEALVISSVAVKQCVGALCWLTCCSCLQ